MLKMTQEMKLSQRLDFRMIQSLKLLPLTVMQLEQRINEELEQNPMLQMDEIDKTEPEKQKLTHDDSSRTQNDTPKTEREGDFTEAEWMKYMEDGFDNYYQGREEFDPNYEDWEPTNTYVTTLADHLTEQLGMVVVDDDERMLGEFIIGSINKDGFLELTDDEIATALDLPVERVTAMVHKIKTLDPPGVGARNLKECLLLQLLDRGLENSYAWKVVESHYNLFTNRKLNDIMKALSISEDQLRYALETIGSLNPRPGSAFEDSMANTAVIPDIVVEKVEGEYIIMYNDWHLPHLTISSEYRRLLSKDLGTSPETRKYLIEKLNNAKWFINSIEQRRTTILKVSKAIIERQHDFLEHGVSHLKPMTLQDIADQVGIAISTVQRVTTGKYIQTPQGVFELKYFFTQRISSSDGSDDFSAKSVKEKMRQIIAEENPKKPLSDQKIADLLHKAGIAISRRAIAKYRDELQITPARLRKQI